MDVLWRRWGDVATSLARLAERNPPDNFRIHVADQANMRAAYRAAHATVCCFKEGYGKAAPNSIIEGMASGRPALVTDTCGIADLVEEKEAGVVTARNPDALAAGIDLLRARYEHVRRHARRLAEEQFDSARGVARYSEIYRQLASACTSEVAPG